MYVKIRFPKNIIFPIFFALIFLTGIILRSSMPVAVATSADVQVKLPIIMYHSFLKDKSLHNKYCISPDLLENDLKYLKAKGYTTVTIRDIKAYTRGKALPKKPVMLTFDDGYYNNYHYAYPLLRKYECKAVLSPVAKLAVMYQNEENISPTYGYCSFKELKQMSDSGIVEIANHSYDLHDSSPRLGAGQQTMESDDTYRKILTDDINRSQKLFSDNSIEKPICFTYPYGAETDLTLDIVKNCGFQCTLTCEEKVNTITRDKESLYELGRFNRPLNESSEKFFERIL